MSETVSQTASLIGQVIEDVTYEAMSPHQYQVQLVGMQRPPQYTLGGFFVFSDLRPGSYRLRIGAEGFQPQEHGITMPLAPGILDLPPLLDSPPLFDSPPVSEAFPIFEQSGDNELVVIVNTLDSSGNAITFDPVILRKEIRADALVLAAGFTTRLAATLDVGRVTRARLATVAGLTVGSIIRIIRGQSIRLKFDPYHPLPFVHTHMAGKVVRRDAPEIPLPGAQVRLTNINGADVVLQEIVGVRIATVTVNTTEIVLGTERDLVSLTNDQGDYHLYFTGTFFEDVTLEVTLDQYQTVLQNQVIMLDRRNSINFQLVKS